MRRRDFLKTLGAAGGGAALGFRLPLVDASGHGGKLFVSVQAEGGWDPTSFCDPKTNTPGEPVINHWAQREEVRQAGRLTYAPFARNAAFFEKYHRRMLVINGVDAQTNAHSTGVVHNWSGRNSVGYPTLSALLAAHYAPALPVAYLSFGGYSQTAGLTRFTRFDNAGLLRNLVHPTTRSGATDREDVWEHSFMHEADWQALESYRAATAERLAAAPDLMPAEARHRAWYRAASAPEGFEFLKAYAAALPPDDQLERVEEHTNGQGGTFESTLRQQAQLTVLAFKTGVAVSADLWLGGFDTHNTHDPDHEWLLGNLTGAVDYLWDYAETHGVADRLVVLIGSDFGRTNFYNAQAGKDHWPIGSYVVMEKSQPWTHRAVGETDALHFAHRIDPATLRRDDANGTIIYPRHVHKALRRYLGVEDTPGARRFPFNNTEDFAFFG